jgi:hypothetical protein
MSAQHIQSVTVERGLPAAVPRPGPVDPSTPRRRRRDSRRRGPSLRVICGKQHFRSNAPRPGTVVELLFAFITDGHNFRRMGWRLAP